MAGTLAEKWPQIDFSPPYGDLCDGCTLVENIESNLPKSDTEHIQFHVITCFPHTESGEATVVSATASCAKEVPPDESEPILKHVDHTEEGKCQAAIPLPTPQSL